MKAEKMWAVRSKLGPAHIYEVFARKEVAQKAIRNYPSRAAGQSTSANHLLYGEKVDTQRKDE